MRAFIVAVISVQFLAAGTFSELAAGAADAKATAIITPVEGWSCLFGGHDVPLHFSVANMQGQKGAVEGRVQWHYSANQRTLARGEVEIRRGDEAAVEVVLRVPEVRDGVIFRTDLTLAFVRREEAAEAASLTKSFWLFPEDPFVDQRETLKARKLSLFDPDGRTAAMFQKIEFPHRQIRNAAALEDHDEHSFVIVGEGTSLIRNRGLVERLLRFASAGGTVLMLAPSEGVLPMPGEAAKDDGDVAQPGELRFCQQDVISEFDKRLDAKAWPGTNGVPGAKLSLRTRLGSIGLEVSNDGDWSWFTIQYPETKGQFVFCGFKLVEHWNNGPTPRYLLDQILTPRPKR